MPHDPQPYLWDVWGPKQFSPSDIFRKTTQLIGSKFQAGPGHCGAPNFVSLSFSLSFFNRKPHGKSHVDPCVKLGHWHNCSTSTTLVRATPPTRLRARDHYTWSTLVGGNGGAGPSSLHTTLEGPTECISECKMDVKSTWILTWHQMDHDSWSLGLFSKITSWR